jgi:hypothetical protein
VVPHDRRRAQRGQDREPEGLALATVALSDPPRDKQERAAREHGDGMRRARASSERQEHGDQ